MTYEFTTIGALIGLVLAIILIIKKVQPAYSLIIGALVGGVIGSGSLVTTVNAMVAGSQSMISSVLRIMTSGILAGTLIKTGAAEKIAEVIVTKLGQKRAIAAPIVVIILLALRPLAKIAIDPLIALPIGGIICTLCCGKIKHIREYSEFGLSKVIGVSVLLIGTGTIAGIIKTSALQYDVINLLNMVSLPAFLLAPISGILMAGATASTTAGATIAAQTFGTTLTSAGVSALASGAMIHAGATVIDSLPHGSFFHATAGAANMTIKERLKLIPYEACVGLTSTIVAIIMYLI